MCSILDAIERSGGTKQSITYSYIWISSRLSTKICDNCMKKTNLLAVLVRLSGVSFYILGRLNKVSLDKMSVRV
jgi:hypothetical protein